MKKFVTMYAKFAFAICALAILLLPAIILDIVTDIIWVIISLFRNKFNMVVTRVDMATRFERKTRILENTIDDFGETIKNIIED